MPDPKLIARAVRLTYAQMMLSAIFGASTGGMFLIGFALNLGADNVWLGLISTIPQFFVVFQFLAAQLVERGISRKWMTVLFSMVTPLCWFFIASIPILGARLSGSRQLILLIGVIALVTIAGQFWSNSRQSWIGDLIPAERRGRFFGYCTFFAGVVGAVFAIIEGRLLDTLRAHGLFAFTALFFFGAVFGLMSAFLNIPQPDCPLVRSRQRPTYLQVLRDTFRNRSFVRLALVHSALALSSIAAPFVPAYCLRDVGMSFFGLGVLNAVSTASMLLFSPLWGRLADRYGCRPVLIAGLLLLAPCGLMWVFIPPGAVSLAYILLPWSNFASGISAAAINVSISSLVYKLSKPEGRSIQFAAYSTFVTLWGAPMPLIGGWLVSRLETAGLGVDLRITFYLWVAFIVLAALLARRLTEPDSVRTRHLVFRHLPAHLGKALGRLVPTWLNPGYSDPCPPPPPGPTGADPEAGDSSDPPRRRR